jgi:hypothetical protein
MLSFVELLLEFFTPCRHSTQYVDATEQQRYYVAALLEV